MAQPIDVDRKVDATAAENLVDETKASPPESGLQEDNDALAKDTLGRLDMVLVPLMIMLYLLAWLDRANVGNARVVSGIWPSSYFCWLTCDRPGCNKTSRSPTISIKRPLL